MLWAAFTTCFQDTSKEFDEATDLTFADVAVSGAPGLIAPWIKIVVLWAAFTTCFQDTSKGFDEATDLTFADVAVDNYQNPSLIHIHLKSSKTDQFGKGADILLARTKDELCPVAVLLHWLVQRGNADESYI